jgi:predicted protein tyrosine phosphatase
MNVLFVCSRNRLRSPTAEAVFASHPDLEVLSAGTNHDADVPISGDLIEWADVVIVMERTHRNRMTKKFRSALKGKRILVLDIRDDYEFMDPRLVDILKRRVAFLLGVPEPTA